MGIRKSLLLLALAQGITSATFAATGSATADNEFADIRGTLFKFCERIVSGTAVDEVSRGASADGFKSQGASSPALTKGKLLLDMSRGPATCSVQPLQTLSFQEAEQLGDAWASGQKGARKLGVVAGPGGSPTRSWLVPDRKIILTAVQQRSANGENLVTFMLSEVRPAQAGNRIMGANTEANPTGRTQGQR